MLPSIIHLKFVDVTKFYTAMDNGARSPKIQIIKAISNLTGLGIKEAKDYMESIVDDKYTVTFELIDDLDKTIFENAKNVLNHFGVYMITDNETIAHSYADATTLEEIAITAIRRKDIDIIEMCVKLLKKLEVINDQA